MKALRGFLVLIVCFLLVILVWEIFHFGIISPKPSPVEKVEEPIPTPNTAVTPEIPFGVVKPAYISAGDRFVHLENNVSVVEEVSAEIISNCGNLSVREAINLAVSVWRDLGKSRGVPLNVWLSLIGSESGFHHWEMDDAGNCILNTNEIGPAYGLSQVYRPVQDNPWYDVVHRDIHISDLYDPENALRLGMKILVERPEQGWDKKVYGYKGGSHHQRYYDLLKDNGIWVGSEFVSFDESAWKQ